MKIYCGKKYEEYKGLMWTSKAKLYHLEGNVNKNKAEKRNSNRALYSHSVSLLPGVKMFTSELSGKRDEMLGITCD